jgi:transcriptional regulator with XRE-family HTH domain
MQASQLADAAGISKSHLSELEAGTGRIERVSADVLYKIAKALGVTMADLLGRPVLSEPRNDKPPELIRFAERHRLPQRDIEMLASIEFRGERPRTEEAWAVIYHAIRSSIDDR